MLQGSCPICERGRFTSARPAGRIAPALRASTRDHVTRTFVGELHDTKGDSRAETEAEAITRASGVRQPPGVYLITSESSPSFSVLQSRCLSRRFSLSLSLFLSLEWRFFVRSYFSLFLTKRRARRTTSSALSRDGCHNELPCARAWIGSDRIFIRSRSIRRRAASLLLLLFSSGNR